MPKWMDELPEDEPDPRKNWMVAALAIVSIGAIAYGFAPQQAKTDRDPPPPTSSYLGAFEELAQARYVEDELIVTMDDRWQELGRGDLSERLVLLMEKTGSFQWRRIVLQDTSEQTVAYMTNDGDVLYSPLAPPQ
jgi:hypothetical protein